VEPTFEQRAWLDPKAHLIPPNGVRRPESLEKVHRHVEQQLRAGQRPDVAHEANAIFRYRDPIVAPLLRELVSRERAKQPLFFLWAIAVLGELGQRQDFRLLRPLLDDDDALVREYAANALGRLALPVDVPVFEARRRIESNAYVVATLDAAVRRATRSRPEPATSRVWAAQGARRLEFFYNADIHSDSHGHARFRPDALEPPLAAHFSFPHQQYLLPLADTAPFPNFGIRTHSGEDSGWFLQGLPVHAVADGLVSGVLYDLSWGTLVSIEHRLPNGLVETSIYAHLAWDLDVDLGEQVVRGQKLGEIGPAVSIENGGYFPHLHHGLVRGPATIRFGGYDSNLARYDDPVVFIPAHP
jgi:murein DD-endopeptidase MepM/ murein hydrolase activator NlpD